MFTTSTKCGINRTIYLAHFVLVLISKKLNQIIRIKLILKKSKRKIEKQVECK